MNLVMVSMCFLVLPLLRVDLLQVVHLETKVRMVDAPIDVVIHSTSLSKQTVETCRKEGGNHFVWKECLFVDVIMHAWPVFSMMFIVYRASVMVNSHCTFL